MFRLAALFAFLAALLGIWIYIREATDRFPGTRLFDSPWWHSQITTEFTAPSTTFTTTTHRIPTGIPNVTSLNHRPTVNKKSAAVSPKSRAARPNATSRNNSDDVEHSGSKPDVQKPIPALPAPSESNGNERNVLSEEEQLEKFGPIVVNGDGSLSKIDNWADMTPAERAATMRRLKKRNAERLERLKKEHVEAGTSDTD
ncbi:hypothetical protein FRB99_000028 [Tulasnella sp. 403]|nr:hypothetical protein FRB99_000028 [Tulasnella sp. 403]